MKRKFFVFWVLVISLQLLAQTLHSIVFIDEKDLRIGGAVDKREMPAFFKQVAATMGYQFNLSLNNHTDYKAVDRVIDNLDISSGDIVVFYYSGHGHNEGESKWPALNFENKNYKLSDIMARMNPKTGRAKLKMYLVDCCNVEANTRGLGPASSFGPTARENMLKLFTGHDGNKTLTISSSKLGQYSYGNTEHGGLFSHCFRHAVFSHTDNSVSNPTWEKVMNSAIASTKQMTSRTSQVQEPQYQIVNPAPPSGLKFDD